MVGIYVLAPRLGSQFPEFTEQARVYWASFGTKLQAWVEYFRTHRMPAPLLDTINGAIPRVIENVSLTVSAMLASVAGWVIIFPGWFLFRF